MYSLPTLTLPLSSDTFIVLTNASQIGPGAVVSVKRGEEKLPVEFTLGNSNQNSNIIATELEVIAAVDHLGPYLITHPFIVETDHISLVFPNMLSHSNGRLTWWAMHLQPYTFQI